MTSPTVVDLLHVLDAGDDRHHAVEAGAVKAPVEPGQLPAAALQGHQAPALRQQLHQEGRQLLAVTLGLAQQP